MPLHPQRFLRGLLSPPRRRSYCRVDGVELATGGRWASAELVVSRGRCRFGRFDLSRVPAAKRGAALALQLGEWSPFSEFDHAVAWTPGGRAMVWCWDLAALRAAWSSASALRMPPTVPESALRPPPPVDGGARLVMTIDGCEAQAWREGEILTSRWWPTLPLDEDARIFVRDAGLDPGEVGHWLTPSDAPLAQRPWIPLTRAGRSGQSGGLVESAVYAALVTSVAVPATVLGVDHSRVRQAQAQVAEELQRESERSKAVLDARNAALVSVEQARALIELQPYPPPLMHMAAVATELPAAATTSLREWQLSDGKLRLLFEATAGDISGADHVRALERTALFDDVKIVTQADPRQMAFQLTLRKTVALDTAAPLGNVGTAGPAAAAAATGGAATPPAR